MEMEYDAFVGEFKQRHTFSERGPAEEAMHAVMATLGTILPEDLSAEVAGYLPEEVRGFLVEPATARGLGLTAFLDEVVDRQNGDVPSAQALRQAQIVVGLVAELVPDEEVERMRQALPGLGPIFDIADEHVSARHAGPPGE